MLAGRQNLAQVRARFSQNATNRAQAAQGVRVNPSGSGNVVTDGTWNRESYDLTAYKNAHLQVRFGYAIVGAGVYEMSCWNVDDVTISTVACP